MLDESFCHFRGIRSVFDVFVLFLWKILIVNKVDPNQMPHYVASDLGLHSLPFFTDFQVRMG